VDLHVEAGTFVSAEGTVELRVVVSVVDEFGPNLMRIVHKRIDGMTADKHESKLTISLK
jgi:hypothetical protein